MAIKTPHGIVPFQNIADVQVRDAVMKLNENIMFIAKKAGEVKVAAPSNVDTTAAIAAIEKYLPQAQEAVNAIAQTLSARDTAVGSAASAQKDALVAKESADSAERAAKVATSHVIEESVGWAHINVDLANDSFYMAGLVASPEKLYTVNVLFVNTATTARTVTVNGESIALAALGTATYSFEEAGDGVFTIDNIATTVNVFVRISSKI